MTQAKSLRILRPAPHILAFYDGRPAGPDTAPTGNWREMGYALGTCSYAVLAGQEALIYDTHLSCAHARLIRRVVEEAGATRIRVVLSHHHTDHIAGNEVFADCPILANTATARALEAARDRLEAGDPRVDPVVLPTETFDGDLDLDVSGLRVGLRSYQIHSHDGLVLWLPQSGILLAGDTLEDPVTYVDEPEHLADHLRELERLAALPIQHILPNHGDPSRIAEGGYPPALIAATARYVRWLLTCTAAQDHDLQGCLADDLAAGTLIYHPAYEAVHRSNIQTVLAHARA